MLGVQALPKPNRQLENLCAKTEAALSLFHNHAFDFRTNRMLKLASMDNTCEEELDSEEEDEEEEEEEKKNEKKKIGGNDGNIGNETLWGGGDANKQPEAARLSGEELRVYLSQIPQLSRLVVAIDDAGPWELHGQDIVSSFVDGTTAQFMEGLYYVLPTKEEFLILKTTFMGSSAPPESAVNDEANQRNTLSEEEQMDTQMEGDNFQEAAQPASDVLMSALQHKVQDRHAKLNIPLTVDRASVLVHTHNHAWHIQTTLEHLKSVTDSLQTETCTTTDGRGVCSLLSELPLYTNELSQLENDWADSLLEAVDVLRRWKRNSFRRGADEARIANLLPILFVYARAFTMHPTSPERSFQEALEQLASTLEELLPVFEKAVANEACRGLSELANTLTQGLPGDDRKLTVKMMVMRCLPWTCNLFNGKMAASHRYVEKWRQLWERPDLCLSSKAARKGRAELGLTNWFLECPKSFKKTISEHCSHIRKILAEHVEARDSIEHLKQVFRVTKHIARFDAAKDFGFKLLLSKVRIKLERLEAKSQACAFAHDFNFAALGKLLKNEKILCSDKDILQATCSALQNSFCVDSEALRQFEDQTADDWLNDCDSSSQGFSAADDASAAAGSSEDVLSNATVFGNFVSRFASVGMADEHLPADLCVVEHAEASVSAIGESTATDVHNSSQNMRSILPEAAKTMADALVRRINEAQNHCIGCVEVLDFARLAVVKARMNCWLATLKNCTSSCTKVACSELQKTMRGLDLAVQEVLNGFVNLFGEGSETINVSFMQELIAKNITPKKIMLALQDGPYDQYWRRCADAYFRVFQKKLGHIKEAEPTDVFNEDIELLQFLQQTKNLFGGILEAQVLDWVRCKRKHVTEHDTGQREPPFEQCLSKQFHRLIDELSCFVCCFYFCLCLSLCLYFCLCPCICPCPGE